MIELKDLLLRAPRLTLGVAESVTTGWVQMRIGETPGASNFYLGGITAYDLEQKIRHLGVERSLAEPVNAVSARVAEQMALGACKFFGSDLGLATTGYAEPLPERKVLQPFAYWGFAHMRGPAGVVLLSGRVECPGKNRIEVQQRVADVALNELAAYVRRFREANRLAT